MLSNATDQTGQPTEGHMGAGVSPNVCTHLHIPMTPCVLLCAHSRAIHHMCAVARQHAVGCGTDGK